MKIVISGGGGYLGRALAACLSERGDEVVVLSRSAREVPGARVVQWDADAVEAWADELEDAAAVVNLAGHSVRCRYTVANKRAIYESRLRSTHAIGRAIAYCENPPPVWLNASSATIYRETATRIIGEANGSIGSGFSADVCLRWETELDRAPTPDTRKVALRTAPVFGPPIPGVMGAYDAFSRLVRAGFGGTIGPGTQWVSWIHVTDFCRAIHWLIDDETLEGPVNVTAPNPLRNHEFLRVLRQELGVRAGVISPRWVLEAGALVMRTETELLLNSRRVVPDRLLSSGFDFEYPDWPVAVRAILAASKRELVPA